MNPAQEVSGCSLSFLAGQTLFKQQLFLLSLLSLGRLLKKERGKFSVMKTALHERAEARVPCSPIPGPSFSLGRRREVVLGREDMSARISPSSRKAQLGPCSVIGKSRHF